jgi:hypothetical protein
MKGAKHDIFRVRIGIKRTVVLLPGGNRLDEAILQPLPREYDSWCYARDSKWQIREIGISQESRDLALALIPEQRELEAGLTSRAALREAEHLSSTNGEFTKTKVGKANHPPKLGPLLSVGDYPAFDTKTLKEILYRRAQPEK